MNDKMINREIQMIENEMVADKLITDIKKKNFINDIKTNLGTEIKKNPNKVKVITKSKKERFFDFIKSLFTKF
jgi:hypothetical protein